MRELDSRIEAQEIENKSLSVVNGEEIINCLTYRFLRRLNGYTGEFVVCADRTYGFFYNPKTDLSAIIDIPHIVRRC